MSPEHSVGQEILRPLFQAVGRTLSDSEVLHIVAHGLDRIEAMSPDELNELRDAAQEDQA